MNRGDGTERFSGFTNIPSDLKGLITPVMGGVAESELPHHQNACVGFRRGGRLVAGGVFRTMFDREVLVLLALGFVPGVERFSILPALLSQAFIDELGFAPGLKFFACPVDDYREWEGLSALSAGRLFPNPYQPGELGPNGFHAAVRKFYGVNGEPAAQFVEPPSQYPARSQERKIRPWWEAQIEGGRHPVFLGALPGR